MKRAVFLATAIAIGGCTVGPDYVRPDEPMPASYEELSSGPPTGVPVAEQADLSRWWLQFGDARLQSLITSALAANLDLQAAASRIREAREQEIVAGAAEYPQLTANGAAVRLHSNSNPLAALGAAGPPSGRTPSAAAASGTTNLHLYSLGFDASWEIDVFGGTRRSVEAARANTEAAQWQLRDGEVSLTAEVANDYLTLRAAQQRIAILGDEQRAQQGVLDVVRARQRAGFVTQIDVDEQQATVAATAAQVPALQAQVRAMEHALAVLLAQPPEAMAVDLDATADLPPPPPRIPVGLPSDLLRRRPDVRRAERKLAAANAQVGVAVASLYPKFDLLGLVSFSGTAWRDLLSAKHLGEIGVGQVAQPIFNAGKNRANVRAMQDEEDQALLAWREAVLGALRDVEDALARYDAEQRRQLDLTRALAAASSSLELARAQYRAQTATYESVYTAQASEASARDQLAQSHATLATDLVSLYKALGGGWQADAPGAAPVRPENPTMR